MSVDRVARALALAASLVAFAASSAGCGGSAPKHVHTETPSWEPPDTFDDLPRTTSAGPAPSEEAAPEAAPAPDAPTAPVRPSFATVSITRRVMPVGSKVDITARTAIQALFTVDTPNGPVTVEDYEGIVDHHAIEVLELRGDSASKARVAFDDKSVTRILNGRQTRLESPVRGKTYVIAAGEQGLAITDAEGRDVSADEGRTIAQEFRGFGTGEALVRAIPTTPMRIGSEVPALAEGLKKDFVGSLEGRVFFGRVSVTPTGTRRAAGVDCVAFAVVLQVGFETKDRKVRMDSKGEMLLRSDNGWAVSLGLAGPVAVDLVEHGVAEHGEGKSRFSGTYVYP